MPILVSKPRRTDKTSTDEQDQILKSRSGGLPKVNTKVFFFFFFSPFSGGLPKVNTRVFYFFFRPFPTGCPGLIPEFVEKKKKRVAAPNRTCMAFKISFFG